MLGTQGRLRANELSFVPWLMCGNQWAWVVELFHVLVPQMQAGLPARKELALKHGLSASATNEKRSYGNSCAHP
jgi:hypothetical protein